MPRIITLLTILTVGLLGADAQDKKELKKDTAAQKAAATANMKKAELGQPTIIETDNFLVATTLTEDKAKALGMALEKLVPVARKALQYESTEEPWKGKLTVYHLPDRREFKSFMRIVVQVQPESVYYDLRGDEPLIVDPVDVPSKATEADQFARTAANVAAAYLKGKGGTANVPEWLADGFGRVVAMRAEGLNSKRYATYRAAARGLASKGVRATDLWGEGKPSGADVLAASVAEFLAFGPMAKDFPKLVTGFRSDENGNSPSVQQALEASGWKDMAALDAAWKKWATTLK